MFNPDLTYTISADDVDHLLYIARTLLAGSNGEEINLLGLSGLLTRVIDRTIHNIPVANEGA